MLLGAIRFLPFVVIVVGPLWNAWEGVGILDIHILLPGCDRIDIDIVIAVVFDGWITKVFCVTLGRSWTGSTLRSGFTPPIGFTVYIAAAVAGAPVCLGGY